MALHDAWVLLLTFVLVLPDPNLTHPTDQSTSAFVLNVFPNNVINEQTGDVTLRCGHGGTTTSQMSHIGWIRLLKKTGKDWTLLAEQRDNEDMPNTVASLNVTASGQVGPSPEETFLELAWTVADANTFGTFRCDVVGFDARASVLTERAPVVKVAQGALELSQVKSLLKVVQTDLRDDINVVQKQVDDVQADLTNLDDDLDELTRESNYSNEEMTRVSKAVDENGDQVSANRKKIASLSGDFRLSIERANATEIALETFDDDISSNAKDIGINEQNITWLRNRLGRVRTKVFKNIEENANLQTGVDSNTKSIRSNAERISSLNNQIVVNANKIDSNSKDIESLNQSYFSYRLLNQKNIEGLNRKVSSFQNDVSSLSGTYINLTKQFTNLELKTNSHQEIINSLVRNTSPLHGKVAAIDDLIATHKAESIALAINVTDLTQLVGQLLKDFETMRSEFSSLRADIVDDKATLSSLNTSLVSQAENLTSLDNRVTSLETDAVTLDQNVQSNTGRVDTLEGNSSLLETRVDSLDYDMTSLRDKAVSLSSDIDAHRAQISSLDDAVNKNTRGTSSLRSQVSPLSGLPGRVGSLERRASLVDSKLKTHDAK